MPVISQNCWLIWLEFALLVRLVGMINRLIAVWMALMFTQGCRVVGNVELVQSFCCKVAWINSSVHDGWLCKGAKCLWRSPVGMANTGCLSICCSCVSFYIFCCFFFFQNTEQGTSDSEAEDEKLEELETMLKEHDPEFQKWDFVDHCEQHMDSGVTRV